MTTNQKSLNDDVKLALPDNDCEQQATPDVEIIEFDYSKRSQWLRAAVLGATDAGACSMAIGEFVSVQSQLDIEVAQIKRDNARRATGEPENEGDKEKLPNPAQASAASAVAFAIGAAVPLLAASFIGGYKLRLGMVVGAVTVALVLFGWLGAVLGKAPIIKSSLTILIGGWFAMAITYGLTKLIGSSEL
ncbi:FE(2+)/MN(2+) TRANSPORTER PCL1 [Salix koriyanagi]|uniref:Vacuolar iron transporter n=1 Tax=Salix koriyanagi TaxID=2511006 RepID=A0A9Q0W2A0_9ROSI|nr:FE(2+)/MN(2+) TRANSPORTER PCL1 [Salix koriyanagi]